MRSVYLQRPDAAELRRYSEGRRGKTRVWWPVAMMLIVVAIDLASEQIRHRVIGVVA